MKSRNRRPWRKCDKQENGSNFKGKNKEQDKHEEREILERGRIFREGKF